MFEAAVAEGVLRARILDVSQHLPQAGRQQPETRRDAWMAVPDLSHAVMSNARARAGAPRNRQSRTRP